MTRYFGQFFAKIKGGFTRFHYAIYVCGEGGGVYLAAKTRALRALAGVGLSLDPERKEKGSWSHSSADLVLTARDAVAL